MNIVLGIVQVALGGMFLMAGVMKAFQCERGSGRRVCPPLQQPGTGDNVMISTQSPDSPVSSEGIVVWESRIC